MPYKGSATTIPDLGMAESCDFFASAPPSPRKWPFSEQALREWNVTQFRSVTNQCTMHQGLSFLEKAITKCLTLEWDFSAKFHRINDFLDEALLTSQKLENKKIKLQISV